MTEKLKPIILTGFQIKQLQKLLGGMAKISLEADKLTIQLDKIILKFEAK
ncbi:MAG: hypothetical protein UW41_C0006G0037 [Candidatus Collierbacteria bacterium GW2011_GWC2_44_18]|uniref:Uncharacterized protein n=1 Tax=Candidatus Collierbacteria bacterium GW2011_GWC2_44_18 TaxID=1618392 RepID=A0A0G1KNC3_9BACT|nr:MAG: hypothetical protein UW41_C0006G0037 [Candidatus Collierbacteria bacterium GW2011_GWC2_44_18]